MAEEVVVPFPPAKEQLAHRLRSTLITTSVQTLRSRGLFARYADALAADAREAITHMVAGVWLPIDIGMTHYTACETLGLTTREQFEIGREVGTRVQGTILGLLVRTAKSAGTTPWAGLTHCSQFYDRLFMGGGVKLIKLGPKEARLETANNPLFALGYFRNGYRGIVCAGTELFCEKAYAVELPKLTDDKHLGLRVSWA